MEETNELEGETPNQETATVEETEAKTTFTLEEVEAIKKEMQSNGDKGVQKLLAEKAKAEETYQIVLSEISKVAESKERLVELFDENPKVAKIILDKYYDGQSINDYKQSIGYVEDFTDPRVIEKRISEEAQKLADKKEVMKEKKLFIEKLKMSDDEKAKFEEAFAERMELKSFRVSDVEKHFEKAYREISDNSESIKTMKSQETIARNMATGDSKGGNDTGKKEGNSEIQKLLRDHGVF